MDTRKLLKSSAEYIISPVSILWSDIRFYWSLKDKTGLVFILSVAFFLSVLAAFIAYYIDSKDDHREINCLALNIYHEARGEPRNGQYAVAEVTMNRVASKHYPDTVCGVVYQQNWDARRKRMVGMFSWTELERKPEIKSRLWIQARKIAELVYNDSYEPKLEGALFYHAHYIKPGWARNKKPITRIGRHIFY